MSNTIISLFLIYIFVGIGFFLKKAFKEKINQMTLVLLSVYFLQPFLVFWGLATKEIDFELVFTPVIFILISVGAIIINYFVAKKLFFSQKERSVFIIASVIGNTGNLGIPFGIAFFTEKSVPYTTIINIANVFIVYSFGVYFYSRGNFKPIESIKNIFKLPILWFAVLAIAVNAAKISIPEYFVRFLQMGAYSSIVLQLVIFGVYLSTVKISVVKKKVIFWVSFVKLVVLPLVSFLIIINLPLNSLAKGVLFLEIAMPLAVTNVNLSALYKCSENEVTVSIFFTSILFAVLIMFYLPLFERLIAQ